MRAPKLCADLSLLIIDHCSSFELHLRVLCCVENDYRMMMCGQHIESESRNQSTGVFRYPERGSSSQYEHCLRKSWIISHEPRYSGQVRARCSHLHTRTSCYRYGWSIAHRAHVCRAQGYGYRVTVRRVSLEQCCDRLVIAGVGSGLRYNYTFPASGYGYLYNTVLYFTQSTLNVSLWTDSSVAGEGFELELQPYIGTSDTGEGV